MDVPPSTRKIRLRKVRQHFPLNALVDVARAVREDPALQALDLRPGSCLAVAVGSRGIANLDVIVREVIQILHARGARPFIIPAMGSHGGATAQGQSALLESFGITETAMACSIRSSMDVIALPNPGCRVDLFMDGHAAGADGIILINRIKPHTDFHGTYESGLVKMAVIGLGKERQALAIHRHGVRGLKELVPEAAAHILGSGRVLLGLGIVENARDETMSITGIPGREILAREPALLDLARRNMPRLPVERLDVLMVDRLGKNISGTGMDTNVIGRIRIPGEPDPASPMIQAVTVADLTPESHGNATGVGLADVTTRRLFGKIDFPATYKNIFTSAFLDRGKIPVIAESDVESLEYALRMCDPARLARPGIIRIRDTLHLEEMLASETVIRELNGRDDIEVAGPPVDLFDETGCLRPF